ncbi:MAG: hypothetical protein FWD14_07975 [Treponema sp.]|nr:hypothetical protein [Treponema sp.]
METKYKLNARDLTHGFVASVQSVYLDRDIEITICDSEDSWDETEYLSRSPVNKEQLDKAIKEIEQGKVISFATLEDAIACATAQNNNKI